MVSPKISFFANIGGFLSFLFCALSGIFLENRILFLNLKEIHLISGYVLIIFVTSHIILHFQWIKNVPKIFAKDETGKN